MEGTTTTPIDIGTLEGPHLGLTHRGHAGKSFSSNAIRPTVGSLAPMPHHSESEAAEETEVFTSPVMEDSNTGIVVSHNPDSNAPSDALVNGVLAVDVSMAYRSGSEIHLCFLTIVPV